MTNHLDHTKMWTSMQAKFATHESAVSADPQSTTTARLAASSAGDPVPVEVPVGPAPSAVLLEPAPLLVAQPTLISTDQQPVVIVEAPQLHILDKALLLDPNSFPAPPRSKKTGPPSTIPNVAYLLREYGITVRYNVIKKKLHITMPGHSGSPDNFDNVALTQINSLALLNRMNTGPIADTVAVIGDRNLYNPVADWIGSKEWDGTDRLPDFYATLTAREDYPPTLKDTLMHRWLVSAVAAVYKESGFNCRGVLTLQGPQGLGKTKWSAALVSDTALRQHVVKLGHHLDAGDKDSQIAAITNWIVEIGELDGSLRRDIARLKGLLTADQDRIRRPYGRTESEYARRTVFCATVNDSNFLVDPTGNSRWWTIPVVAIDYAHTIDMQQVWAQVRCEYEAGVKWWLATEEEALLSGQNAQHRTESVVRDGLLAHIDTDRIGTSGLTAMTSTEVLKLIGIEHPTNAQSKECCGALRELLGESKRIQGQQKWRVPVRVLDLTPEDDDEVRPTRQASSAHVIDDAMPY